MIQPARDDPLGLQQLDDPPVPLRLVLDLVVETHVLERHRLRVVLAFGEIDHGSGSAANLPDDFVLADALRSSLHAFRWMRATAVLDEWADCCTNPRSPASTSQGSRNLLLQHSLLRDIGQRRRSAERKLSRSAGACLNPRPTG